MLAGEPRPWRDSVPAAGALARLLAVLRRRSVLALGDQAVVSGASFVTTILIGRFGHPEHLGLFSLGWSILLGLMAVQMSLLTTPYAVHHHREDICSRTYAGSTTLLQLLMLAFVAAGLALAALCVGGPMRAVLWAMVVAVPLLLLREFGRRMAYADLSVGRAFAIDAPVATGQVTGLALLGAAGALSAGNAFLAMGAAAAIGTAVGLIGVRRRVEFSRQAIGPDARRSWSFGRWIAGSQLLGVANTQGTFWVVAAVAGTAATGIYAACLAIVLLCNPFLLAVGNILTPRAAEVLAQDGRAGLRRLIVRACALLGAVMTLFCVALGVWGDTVTQVLYGPEYAGHGPLITVLALSFLVSAVGMALNDGLRALNRADVEFISNILDTVLSVGLGVFGLIWFGLIGLAWANLLGSVVALAIQAFAFARYVGRREPEGVTS